MWSRMTLVVWKLLHRLIFSEPLSLRRKYTENLAGKFNLEVFGIGLLRSCDAAIRYANFFLIC